MIEIPTGNTVNSNMAVHTGNSYISANIANFGDKIYPICLDRTAVIATMFFMVTYVLMYRKT